MKERVDRRVGDCPSWRECCELHLIFPPPTSTPDVNSIWAYFRLGRLQDARQQVAGRACVCARAHCAPRRRHARCSRQLAMMIERIKPTASCPLHSRGVEEIYTGLCRTRRHKRREGAHARLCRQQAAAARQNAMLARCMCVERRETEKRVRPRARCAHAPRVAAAGAEMEKG